MVNSATSDLTNLTQISRALFSVGGMMYQLECSRHRNVAAGDIVTTIGGDLRCKYVIHAVCCDWRSRHRDGEVSCQSLVRVI